ncbi:MAG: tRNA (adenosine(37)-N6)-dimethylallyltransferase MiaA [Bryobacteraceae bacterium]
MRRLIAIVGPTGAGKTDLALALAVEFSGEIVSCDSVQVHTGLNIGSAKTPVNLRRSIPHHMIDILPPEGELTAGAYARRARMALADIAAREKVPILVGGTGFYLRALLDGLSPAPERDPDLRGRLARMESGHPGYLHRYLRRFDPSAASRIHRKDLPKLTRAVEIMTRAGRPTSEIQREPRTPLIGFSVLKIGLAPDRAELRRRIDLRTLRMFEGGLIDETRTIIEAGCPPNAKALQSLGYRQAVEVLSGQSSLDKAVVECQLKTRQYAKRQMTWFRRDVSIRWLAGFGTDPPVQQDAIERTRHWLLTSSVVRL